jgi:threonine dehydratase
VAGVTGLPISPRDVEAAAARLAGIAHRTPVLRSRTLDERVGAAAVHLKAEGHQRTGSFKFRGAYNKLASLTPAERRRGVAAVSSGNHAQAVALAARLHDCAATILMPEDAPASKTAATRGYGAEVVTYDRYATDREDGFVALCAERDLVPVHPFDDPAVMAGQGTAALELLEDAGELDLLLVCVGGGGLISGCATIAAERSPGVRIVGVEPEAGDDFRRSLEAGRRVGVPVPRTIADGQATPMPGELTFAVVDALVEAVVTVTDDEIRAAMRLLFERLKVVAEPSGACALAALLAGRVPGAEGARVGVTLSGGNVDADRFARVLAGGN